MTCPEFLGKLADRPFYEGEAHVSDLIRDRIRQGGELVRLHSNENLALSRDEVQSLQNKAAERTDPRLYPSPDSSDLITEIARFHRLSPDQIVVGNGSDGIWVAISRAVGRANGTALTTIPTKSIYSHVLWFTGVKELQVPIKSDFSLDPELTIEKAKNADVVFICSPNNPTGTQFIEEDILQVVENTKALVCIDETYVEFADYSMVNRVNEYDNIMVTRSFSIAWGLAAARIGFAVGNPLAMKRLRGVLPAYSVNGIGQMMAMMILQDPYQHIESIELLKHNREKVRKRITRISDELIVTPSKTNFHLIRIPNKNPDSVFAKLLELGILVRQIPNGDVLKNAFRVTVSTRKDNEAFVNAIGQVIELLPNESASRL